jgi:hypothetical protein
MILIKSISDYLCIVTRDQDGLGSELVCRKTGSFFQSTEGCLVKDILVFAMLALLSIEISACVVAKRVEIQPVSQGNREHYIAAPLKVHLKDGGTGIFLEGWRIVKGEVRGKSNFYDITLISLSNNPRFTPVPLDSIAAMETYRERLDRGKTAALIPVSILLTAAGGFIGFGGGGVISTGVKLDKFGFARIPGGARCEIQMPHRVIVGEFIAAQDDGIVLLREKLRFIRYEYIVALEFGGKLPQYKVMRQRTLKPDVLEQIRYLSRFPQGLSPELLQKLLQAYEQTELMQTRG